MKKLRLFTLFVLFAYCLNAQMFRYPPTQTVQVEDNYFGTTIQDPYRWLEDLKAPEVKDWFQLQADFTKNYLHKINGREKLLKNIQALTQMRGDIIGKPYKSQNHYYYLKALKGDNFYSLYQRDTKSGKETLFFDGQAYKKGSKINDFVVNDQGNVMALKIQEEGREICEVIFMKLPEQTILKDKLYPIWGEFPINFLPDGKAMVYTQLVTSDPNSKELLKNMKVKLHVLGTNSEKDKILFSATTHPELKVLPEKLPFVTFSADNQTIFIGMAAATNYYESVFYTEVKQLNEPKIQWKPLIKATDQIASFNLIDNQIFFVTFKNAPHFKIGVTQLDQPNFDHAKTIVPSGEETITFLESTKNYLFFEKSNGVTSTLYRLDPKNHQITQLITPGGINLGTALNKNESDGVVVRNTNWLSPIYFLEVDLSQSSTAVESKWLNTERNFPDFTQQFDIQELEIPGHDGVMIPLSIIYPKNIKMDGTTPCYITGYGGYGISFYPSFLAEEIAFLQQGGMIAIAHVRGGGEKGEDWYQAGRRETKPNTWKDFISSAEYLIREKYTSPQKLIGEGTSAGGILIGRAMTERPDLFAVAINNVGMTQVLRNEATANGDNHIPEMGSVKIKADVPALIEMDVQSKIRSGVNYPATLTITGINDSRVAPWMPAKFTAALQKHSTSGKPILLSVNYKGSHGPNDIAAYHSQLADIFSFALWQIGHPDFQLTQ
ncbi:MAG TPA: prolyl oligopeptidase family serine peptidase [Moheibacter sp.]|nr:prolyl oligopeptidase family serine peptidase [Moheibacter sp.]